jgi:hypothetical protein
MPSKTNLKMDSGIPVIKWTPKHQSPIILSSLESQSVSLDLQKRKRSPQINHRPPIVSKRTTQSHGQDSPYKLREQDPFLEDFNRGFQFRSGRDTLIFAYKTLTETTSDCVMFKEVEKGVGERELEILKNISHTNILPIRESFICGNICYVGLKYVRWTLQEAVATSRFNEPQIQFISKSVHTLRILIILQLLTLH